MPPPEGPQANDDEFSPLASIGPGATRTGRGREGSGKSSQRRPSSELRELIGIVGEIHAFRFLRAKFGAECVSLKAWVSENRLKAQPPVPGEPNEVSDGHGFDFRFRQGKRTWHVEVKATSGDEPQFDLGISEIEAASRLANDRLRPWRVLRITQALGEAPEFEWLPNPFEDEHRMLFRFQKGGMKVSYLRDDS